MARVTSAEIEATLRVVGQCRGSELDGLPHLMEWGQPHPFDLVLPDQGRVRRAAEVLADRGMAGVSGDADLWALTLESAVVVAVRSGDLDTAAALGRAAASLGSAGLEAADCAAAFIVSRRSAESGLLRTGPENGSGTAGEATVAACARALRTILQGRETPAQRKVGDV